MIFVLICTYLGIWGCAYAAVSSGRGKLAFWGFYAIALMVVPVLSTVLLRAAFQVFDAAYAASISPLSWQIGVVLALVAYPVKYLRAKSET